MLRSQDRILTTHTGSLPRPAALTQLYVRRSRGEPIDTAELDRVGKQAVRDIVAKQITAASTYPTTASSSARLSFSTSAIA
jgi:5-methyltetrahydropteroyltriglutamate--homocysteine methyltransferase